jgi:COMPASS component SWD2
VSADLPPHNPLCKWHALKISNDSKSIIISTNSNYTILADGNSGEFRRNLSGYSNDTSAPLEASFTPDSQFALCGKLNF